MTTDELLMRLPAYIGNRIENGCYIMGEEGDDIQWLYLHNDGKDWIASYGVEGKYLCLNPKAPDKSGFYNNAFAYGKTPNEALQKLYNWCTKNGFIEDEKEDKN